MKVRMKLKKLSARRDWTSNVSSALPASWQVVGADIFLIGESGSHPSYSVAIGGTFHLLRGHEGGRTVSFGLAFKDAKALAEKLASTPKNS